MVFRGFFLVCAIVILAACAPIPSGSLSPLPTPTSVVAVVTDVVSAATPAEAQATPESSRPVITLIRSGGLAGRAVQWDVYPDGRVRSSSGHETVVPEAEVTQVLSDIEKLGFYDLAEPGSKNNRCADCFLYTITVRIGGKDRTLAFMPEATDTPAELLQIVERANSLLQALPQE